MEEELIQEMESSVQSVGSMTVDQFKSTLADRLDNLTDEEKLSLLDMYGSEELQLIGKLLGPEITGTVTKQLNLMAEDAVLNPEGVQPVDEFEGRMQREETEDQTEQMFRQPPPEMRVQEELEDQPDTLV
ncbi:hypothetical protein CRP1_gp48 [Roseobacter phage CRP-1]|nr:hypothetical protein CRP1_gp48 [Roseobacter phage CRP-1]